MTFATKKAEIIRVHTKPPKGMMFYESLESIRCDANLLGSMSVISRAWQEMKLDGVLCLDGRPVLYLKVYGRPFSRGERNFFQRLFWNQGVANILVLIDPKSVSMYSGLTKPQNEPSDDSEHESGLIETLTLSEYTRQIQTLYHSLASGNYYEAQRSKFDPDQTVDARLLDSLRTLRDFLTQGDRGLSVTDAHAFIGRVLFLCYLLDRKIVSLDSPIQSRTPTLQLATILEELNEEEQIEYLYGLFFYLKGRFNGNMFDQNLEEERKRVKPDHIKKLALFLGGHDVDSGQKTLWPFDFKMIPVETISSIYEDFLSREDPKDKRKLGAFYTPRFLVEMVVDTAVRDEPGLLDGAFLDPACGSGIFLVTIFHRLANRWICTHPGKISYAQKAEALQNILVRQIQGVDIKETACRIACFSLYLAYLDFFDPPDINAHIEKLGKPLPKLLDYGDTVNRPKPDIPAIHLFDFLAENSISDQSFDCVIGNPPWEGRGSKQLAQKYLQAIPRLLKKKGTGCLLLPTKILQNKTDTFQAKWLKEVTLQKVLQLADYRFLLFQNAICPAFIARFKNAPPTPNHHLIEFSAPKFDRSGLRQGIVTVDPSARTWLSQSVILKATKSKSAPVVWKRRLWGTQRDQKLLDILYSLPKLSELAGKPSEGKRWIKGQGFQPFYPRKAKTDPNYPPPKHNPWSLRSNFIDAKKSIQLIAFPYDCMTLGKILKQKDASLKHLRRTPNKNLFKSPLLIVSQGSGKVAFCDFNVLFQDSLQSIAAPKEDAALLKFLTVYLRSSLARYFLFHTSANWGTERDKVHLTELLRIPFPLPGNEFVSTDAEKILNEVCCKFEKLRINLERSRSEIEANEKQYQLFDKEKTDISTPWHKERKKLTDAMQAEFDQMIYQYFQLSNQEIAIIEDTINIFEPSSTPSAWNSSQTVTLDRLKKTEVEPYASHGLGAYANTLTSTLNDWARAEGSPYRVKAEGGTDNQTGLTIVTICLTDIEKSFKEISLSRNFSEKLKSFHQKAAKKHGSILYQRDLFLFHGEQIHIVRPDRLINWTRTAALNDATRIYGDIAMAGESR